LQPDPAGSAPLPRRRRRRLNKSVLVPAVPVALGIVVALLAPWIAPYDPATSELAARLRPPFWEANGSLAHPLGTDLLGRDLLSRVLYGARVSLPIAFAATLLGAVIGSALGLFAGYAGGRLDRGIMVVADIQLAFPFILFAISAISVAGPSLTVLIVVLAIGAWVGHARIVRGLVLSLREREYVLAARCVGATTSRILRRHLLPNVAAVIFVVATFDVGRVIVLESTLSFLGLGVQPPTPSWGSDLKDAAVNMRLAWWAATFPGLAILLVVLGVNLLGDALRDVMDPRAVRSSGLGSGR
jgi:peptide/nickel transport system permease protein